MLTCVRLTTEHPVAHSPLNSTKQARIVPAPWRQHQARAPHHSPSPAIRTCVRYVQRPGKKERRRGEPPAPFRQLGSVNVDLLVHEFFDAESAELAAETASLDTTKAQVGGV
jgi:hypothetical protein